MPDKTFIYAIKWTSRRQGLFLKSSLSFFWWVQMEFVILFYFFEHKVTVSPSSSPPSGHLVWKWRRINVDATSSRRIDVNTTSFWHQMPFPRPLLKNPSVSSLLKCSKILQQDVFFYGSPYEKKDWWHNGQLCRSSGVISSLLKL